MCVTQGNSLLRVALLGLHVVEKLLLRAYFRNTSRVRFCAVDRNIVVMVSISYSVGSATYADRYLWFAGEERLSLDSSVTVPQWFFELDSHMFSVGEVDLAHERDMLIRENAGGVTTGVDILSMPSSIRRIALSAVG